MKNNSNKIRFATIFSDMENFHLIKDPGMIPFTMQKEYGWKSIVPLSSLHKYEYKRSFYKCIDTPIIQDSENKKNKNRARAIWIWKNASKIDVLNIFFFDRVAWIDIFIYKLRNSKGLIYVHCDTDGNRLINYKYPKNPIKLFLIKKIFLSKRNIKDVLWGIQNKENIKALYGVWPFENLVCVPDGFYWENNIHVKYEQKNNIILTVARNGVSQKRTDILLEGFAALADEFPTWRLKLVGTVENTFYEYIEKYFKRYPKLQNRVEFAGPIYDRKELEKIYSESKIFCLTSGYESFGIATIEAISKGCYVVASDIPSTVEITNNGEYGLLFKNGDLRDFIEKLRFVLLHEELIREKLNDAILYANELYSWKNILKPVYNWIVKQIG